VEIGSGGGQYGRSWGRHENERAEGGGERGNSEGKLNVKGIEITIGNTEVIWYFS